MPAGLRWRSGTWEDAEAGVGVGEEGAGVGRAALGHVPAREGELHWVSEEGRKIGRQESESDTKESKCKKCNEKRSGKWGMRILKLSTPTPTQRRNI